MQFQLSYKKIYIVIITVTGAIQIHDHTSYSYHSSYSFHYHCSFIVIVIVPVSVTVTVTVIVTIIIQEVKLHLSVVWSLLLYVFALFCLKISEFRQAWNCHIRGINAFHCTIRYVVVTITPKWQLKSRNFLI